ncbi:MAG: c-type cytochrome [Chitinophagaceae bacterium]|nr:c-type cytochrome [Chitinophagaceae bacterium]
MKKVSIITVIVLGIVIWGCSDVKREPSRVYMPDMAYSRAYETYASTANLDSLGIQYTRQPVPGTIKRGELFPFAYAQDKAGDSTNYVLSKQVPNPIDSMQAVHMKEAERLYLVNCGICHGTKLDGNGPLYNAGNGPYAAAPKNLVTLDMPDGQMFYSITYGKGQMGPYGPQLSTTQRWMIINYIRAKQAEAKGGGATSTTAKAGDSTATIKAPADSTVKK